MKISLFETHDRLEHFKKDQWETISQGAEDCLKKNRDSLAIQSKCPYVYLFAHPRTADNGIDKRLLWQPRISRPKPQTNSYLFRAISFSDTIEICWLLPPRELWGQYDTGKVTESSIVQWSIHQFEYNREFLEANHPEDLPEARAKEIYKEVLRGLRFKKI